VGANASGKSNIRDAFRFLHGVGRGYSLPEIIGGKYGAGGQLEWAPPRGGANEIIRLGCEVFEIAVNLTPANSTAGAKTLSTLNYDIIVENPSLRGGGFRVNFEVLKRDGSTIYLGHEGNGDPTSLQGGESVIQFQLAKTAPRRGGGGVFSSPADRPALDMITRSPVQDPQDQALVRGVRDTFGGIRFLDLVPDQMRKPSFPGQTVLGDSGENLSTVLREICQAPERKAILIDWIQELTPWILWILSFRAIHPV
jgi:hypothetical protein